MANEITKVTDQNGVDHPFKDAVAQVGVIANTKLIKDTVGWSGKNKLVYPYKQTTLTNRGITFTDNNNGSLTLDGTQNDPSANAVFQLHGAWNVTNLVLPAGKWTLTTGVENDDIVIEAAYSNQLLGTSTNGVLTLDAPNGISYITIGVKKGKTVNNITVKPMIYDADILDPTYEPYFGSTAVDWASYAKTGAINKLENHAVSQSTPSQGTLTYDVDSDGVITGNGTNGNSDSTFWVWGSGWSTSAGLVPIEKTKLKKGETYTLYSGNNDSDSGLVFYFYNENTFISSFATWNGTGKTNMTVPANATHIVCIVRVKANKTIDNVKYYPMIVDQNVSIVLPKDYAPYAMTNKELTDKVQGIINAATNAADFAAFKTAIGNL